MPTAHAFIPLPKSGLILAWVLMGALVVGGGYMGMQLRMVPGTLVAPAALIPKPHPRSSSSVQAREPSTQPAAGPQWEILSTPQKLALFPLAERWAMLSGPQKRRWLALAQNFASLSAMEQAKLHSRMTEWASLSGQQRSQARLNYADTNRRLAPDDKWTQWQAYQALSAEEKRALADGAVLKPRGAATALRPVPTHKLAQVPAATTTTLKQANTPKIPPTAGNSPRIAAPVTPIFTAQNNKPSAAIAPIAVETTPVIVPMAAPAGLAPMRDPSSVPPAVGPDVSSDLYSH